MVTAIILAGGLGTRLASAVPDLPKALAPIQGVPFIHILLSKIQNCPIFTQIILALGHKAPPIESYIKRTLHSVPIECSIESSPLGTGGALLLASKKAQNNSMMVFNGDTYFDFSFIEFHKFHLAKEAEITVACRRVEETSRYGSLDFDSSQRIYSFNEKSSISYSGWINGGVYLLEKRILNPFCYEKVYSIENDFFPQFLSRPFFAFPSDGTFIDIGTPETYLASQEILKPWIRQ